MSRLGTIGRPACVNYARWDDSRYLMALMKFKGFRIFQAYSYKPDKPKPYWIGEPIPNYTLHNEPSSISARKWMRFAARQTWKQRISTDIAEKIIKSKWIIQTGRGAWYVWEWNVKEYPPKSSKDVAA